MNKVGLLGASILVIVVGLPVAAYLTVLRPLDAEISKSRAEIKHMESLLAKLQEETARNADLVRANADTQNAIQMIEARLPTNQEIDAIVRQVSDLAVQSGMEPPGIKTTRALPAGLYMEQPLDMELTGSFEGFFNFISSLERMPRITRIHDMKLEALRDDDGPEMRALFTLSIYYQEDSRKMAEAR